MNTTETDTTTTENVAVDAADDTAALGEGEEYARLDPTTLEVGPNVRDHVDTGSQDFRDLVASIVVHGVVQAISAVRDGEKVVVIDGQRRTLAAIDAGAHSVPVLIRTVAAEGKEREVDRLTTQLVTNDRRTGLTDGQRAKAVTDMLELGVSVTKIAKTVQLGRESVKAAGAAGRSQTALDALDSGQLDLEQAAIVATFDADGDTAAVEELLGARYNFRWTAQRLLADRAERAERTAAAAPYAERGFTVLDAEPGNDSGYIRADDLVSAADGSEVTAELIDADPAQWAVWLGRAEQITVTATGEVIEEEQIDWATDGDPDATAQDGYHHMETLTFAQVWALENFTADPAAAGTRLNDVLTAAKTDTVGDAADPQSRAQAAAAAELAHKEVQRAERRRTVDLNKASAAATAVRKDWVRTFLTRKTLPKGAAAWITATLLDDPNLLSENKAPLLLAELLSVTVPDATGPEAGYPGAADRAARAALAGSPTTVSDARAQVLLLAQLLAAYEARMSGKGHDSWRRTAWGNLNRYLTFLSDHGHELMPVENAAAGELTAEQAHQEHTAMTTNTD